MSVVFLISYAGLECNLKSTVEEVLGFWSFKGNGDETL
jgi:hypothetical protein